MKLRVVDRILLLNILPGEGNFITLKIVRDLKGALSFSEEELKALSFKMDDEKGTVVWKAEADLPRDIAIGEKATDLIVEALKKKDKEQKLTEQYYSLYERFVEKGGKDG